MTLHLPTPEQLARIYSELKMTPEGIERDVKYLKEWLRQQPHLPDDIDDRMLRNALIFRKNSLEKVKESLDLFYSIKSNSPEVFSNRDPLDPSLKNELDNTFCYPLPRLTPDGSRVMVFKLFSGDTSLFHYPTVVKHTLMISAIDWLEDKCLNHSIVLDLQGITMGHLATVSISLASKFLYIAQKAFPVRQKIVHLIYAPPYVNALLAVFQPFMQKKLVERINIHPGGLGNIFESIPHSVLPVDYGGEEISLREIQAQWRKKLLEYRDWFLRDDQLLVDEKKRPGKIKTPHEFFGFEGSFRQLNVD